MVSLLWMAMVSNQNRLDLPLHFLAFLSQSKKMDGWLYIHIS